MQHNLALKDDALQEAERLVRSVGLPPQPQVVVDVNFELAQLTPDFGVVAELLGSDPALTAKTLKLTNSAMFGVPKQIHSIKQAISLLGIDNLYNIVVAAALEEALKCRDDALNGKFWRHSLMVARTTEMIAERLLPKGDTSSYAYLAGLFHDCAIPLFRRRFAHYDPLVEQVLAAGPEAVEEENRLFNTDHCVVGFLVARAWLLPEPVCEAIWFHHESALDMHSDPLARSLKAALLMADYISVGDGVPAGAGQDELIWAEEHQSVLDEMGLDVEGLKDLKEEALLNFGSS